MVDIEQQSFDAVSSALSGKIYEISSDVRRLRKQLPKLARDANPSARSLELSDLMVSITDKCALTNKTVDSLGSWPASDLSVTQRQLQQQLTSEFRSMLKDVHSLQQSLSKAAQAVADARKSSQTVYSGSLQSANSGEPSENTPLMQLQAYEELDVAQVDSHTWLIEDRGAEIAEIQRDMLEINSIFKDIGTLVTEQGAHIDTIENNISNLAQNTNNAAQELTKADRSLQSRTKCSLMVFLALLVITILVALSIFA